MRKFRTFDFRANAQYQVFLPQGWYKGIGIAFEGTNDAGQTLTIAQLGTVRLYRAGKKVWDVSLDRIFGLVDRVMPGAQRFSSTVASTVSAFIYLPMHWNDGNVVRLGGGQDDYVLEFQHDSITAVVTALQVTVVPQSGLGVQNYFPLYTDYSIRSLSSETDPEEFPRRNLAYVTLTPTANITVAKLIKDKNMLYDLTDEQLDFQTNLESESKTFVAAAANSTPWVFNLYKEHNRVEVWGNSYAFGAVSTDASITGMTVEFEPSPMQQELTAQIVNGVLAKQQVALNFADIAKVS